ncbi:MAG: formate dehydrogenase subunit alpha [Armatimonadetes bacterium]|nr:formate dehydrogenase subunit alpha [Armatimonadota bacterium]
MIEWVRSICPFCGVGCGFLAGVERNRLVGLEYLTDHPVCEGALCPKGNAALETVHHADRLLHPLVRKGDGFERISWDEALEGIAARLLDIQRDHGADAVGFLASAKCTNEENYLLQKWARLFGTNNIDHCARLCHASTVAGLARTLGAGAMTNPMSDVAHSDCIFVIGSNFTECHPLASRWVGDALERGAFLVVADPRVTPVVWQADLHLRHRPGSDVALLNGMMKVILQEGLHNEGFIAARTSGFDVLRQSLAAVDLAAVEEITGVPVAAIQEAARRYARAKASVIMWSMGITQHTTGVDNVISLANLALLAGHVGRPGAGLMPLRGQSNVQGACDMGALSNFLTGYVPVTDAERRARIAAQWGTPELPAAVGLTVVEMMHAAGTGALRALYVMGENPMITDPNVDHVREGLRNLDLLVVQDIFLTETAELADYVLPAALWAEKAGSYTNTERRVQWQPRLIPPPGEALPDWQIIASMGRLTGWADQFDVPSPEPVLAEINAVSPAYRGVTQERTQALGGVTWPCPEEGHPGTPILHETRFATADGLGHLEPIAYRPPAEQPDDRYPLVLTTGRTVLHYNSGSMTRRSKALLTRERSLFVEISPADAAQRGLEDGQQVRVSTRRGDADCLARVTSATAAGVVFMPFHFAGANVLTNDALDPTAKIPEYKVAACQIEGLPR